MQYVQPGLTALGSERLPQYTGEHMGFLIFERVLTVTESFVSGYCSQSIFLASTVFFHGGADGLGHVWAISCVGGQSMPEFLGLAFRDEICGKLRAWAQLRIVVAGIPEGIMVLY